MARRVLCASATMLHLSRALVSTLVLLLVPACDPPAPARGTNGNAPLSQEQAAAALAPTGDPGRVGLVVLNPSGPRATFRDFDRVQYGSQPQHVYRLKNDEARAVTIQTLQPACGCLKVRLRMQDEQGTVVEGSRGREGPVMVIPPGREFELVCTIDTTLIERMNLDKLAQVRMVSDSARAPYLTFELHLIVERVFRAVPAVADIGFVPRTLGKSKRVDIVLEPQGPGGRILGVQSVEGPFTATLDATEIEGTRFWIADLRAQPDQPLGLVRGKLVLATEDLTGRASTFEVPIHATIAEDVMALPAAFAFGNFGVGTARTATIELTALAEDEVLASVVTRLVGDHADKLEIERTPQRPGADGRARVWRMTLKAPSNLPFGTFTGQVEFTLDHPRVPKVVVPYHGNAR